MRSLVLFAAAAAGIGASAMSTPSFGQTANVSEQCVRTKTSFDLTVHASYDETAPLFGPEGERPWAGKHWDPQFIYPRPARDEEGAVFTVQHGPVSAVWVNTVFDVEGRHFQYAYFIAGLMVTTIDVRFNPVDVANTQVHVVYTRTAPAPEGNEHVTAMTEGDHRAGKEWQEAIDTYLANRKR